jgi:hypothetical protein
MELLLVPGRNKLRYTQGRDPIRGPPQLSPAHGVVARIYRRIKPDESDGTPRHMAYRAGS